MAGLSSPRPIRKDDDRYDFDCGERVLNRWLRRHAWGNEVTNASRTYVVIDEENGLIAGFVSLATGQIERAFLSKSQQRNQPDPIPVLVLGQLAIDTRYQGRRLGVSLLKHAFDVAVAASQKVGIVGVVTHSLNQEVRSFYQRWGFENLPGDPEKALIVRIRDLLKSGF